MTERKLKIEFFNTMKRIYYILLILNYIKKKKIYCPFIYILYYITNYFAFKKRLITKVVSVFNCHLNLAVYHEIFKPCAIR